MSVTGQNLTNQINAVVRNYAPDAFHNMGMNNILLLFVQWIDSIAGSGSGTAAPSVVPVTAANFTTATDCPQPLLNGDSLVIFWNDVGKFLTKGTDWIDFVGGGFTIIIPGFDATGVNSNCQFYIYTA
jgi:hypothetical protein